MPHIETKDVPVEALRLSLGTAWKFSAETDETNATDAIPVTLVARSGAPILHGYWGKMVHDLSGMRLHKDRLPIDYCHDEDQVLGYLDKFEVDDTLVCRGALTPFNEADRANEVVHKQRQGVPYEASICWDGPLKLEELDDGTEATVNGYTVHGPALIVREWSLRGVAICPYGHDRDTETQLKRSTQVTITRETRMGTTQTPDTPADPKAELQRYVDTFGAENGSSWFLEGLTFSDAQAKQAALTVEQNETLSTKVTELTGQLETLTAQANTLTTERDAAVANVTTLTTENERLHAAVDTGEQNPLGFSAGGDDKGREDGASGQADSRFGNLRAGTATFAGSLKLPNARQTTQA